MAQTPEENLAALGIQLPLIKSPIANYVNVVRAGNLLYLSGKGPIDAEGKWITGKLGSELTIEEGYEAARKVAIEHIAVLKSELGELAEVRRIVKVTGMVNSTPDFMQHPKVLNGYSDMMVAVFGEAGKHARTAVGMCSLPFDMAVEVDIIVEIAD